VSVDSSDDVGLAKECCHKALKGKWKDGKIIVCGGCFLPYTAFIDAGVPSWWTGLREAAQ
jgi:hypothetical protein